MNRRTFLASIAALPIIGKLCPAHWHDPRELVFNFTTADFPHCVSELVGTVNSKTWHDAPPGCWRFVSADCDRVANGWRVRALFERGRKSFIVANGRKYPLYEELDYNDYDFGEAQ